MPLRACFEYQYPRGDAPTSPPWLPSPTADVRVAGSDVDVVGQYCVKGTLPCCGGQIMFFGTVAMPAVPAFVADEPPDIALRGQAVSTAGATKKTSGRCPIDEHHPTIVF